MNSSNSASVHLQILLSFIFLMQNKLLLTENGENLLSAQPRIERLHSRDKPPYCFTQTKDDFCIKIEFNSERTGLVHQYGRLCFLFLNINMAAVTLRENAP